MELSETDIFDGPFIDKQKFKLILNKLILESSEPIYELENIINKTISICVNESITEALHNLTEHDVVETVINKDGELAYRLKQ